MDAKVGGPLWLRTYRMARARLWLGLYVGFELSRTNGITVDISRDGITVDISRDGISQGMG